MISVLEWLEKFAYCKADRIVAVTEAFRRHIVACGTDSNKVAVIRNGVDLSFFRDDLLPDEEYAEQLGVQGKFIAAYVGTHGMAHGLDTLLDAAELLKDRDDIVFLMAGDGAERARLSDLVSKHSLSNVRMLGQLPKAEMPRLWSITGVSLVLLKKLDLFRTVIPSKIFESMAMRRPIILAVRGESQEIIEQAECGICIEPENARDLADAVVRLAGGRELCQRMGNNGLRCVQQEFDRRVLAERYEAELRVLAAPEGLTDPG